MLLYVLICLCLALAGVAGLQMMYMLSLEAIHRDRKKYLADLEQQNKLLRSELAKAREQLAALAPEENWAEVIEER